MDEWDFNIEISRTRLVKKGSLVLKHPPCPAGELKFSLRTALLPLVFISLCDITHSDSCYYTDYPDELVRSSPSHSAHADCNLEITPNEEFLKNMAAARCRRHHTAPCPNGFPGIESIRPPLSPCRGSSKPGPLSLPPTLALTLLHPHPLLSTNWGWLVLVKRSHNHCFCC